MQCNFRLNKHNGTAPNYWNSRPLPASGESVGHSRSPFSFERLTRILPIALRVRQPSEESRLSGGFVDSAEAFDQRIKTTYFFDTPHPRHTRHG